MQFFWPARKCLFYNVFCRFPGAGTGCSFFGHLLYTVHSGCFLGMLYGQWLDYANHRKSKENLAHFAVLLLKTFQNHDFLLNNKFIEPFVEPNGLVEPKLVIG